MCLFRYQTSQILSLIESGKEDPKWKCKEKDENKCVFFYINSIYVKKKDGYLKIIQNITLIMILNY